MKMVHRVNINTGGFLRRTTNCGLPICDCMTVTILAGHRVCRRCFNSIAVNNTRSTSWAVVEIYRGTKGQAR